MSVPANFSLQRTAGGAFRFECLFIRLFWLRSEHRSPAVAELYVRRRHAYGESSGKGDPERGAGALAWSMT